MDLPLWAGNRAIRCSDLSRFVQICPDFARFVSVSRVCCAMNPEVYRLVSEAVRRYLMLKAPSMDTLPLLERHLLYADVCSVKAVESVSAATVD